MTEWLDADAAPLAAFLASLAIGLLVGVERERNPAARAGLRTFALTAVFGTLAAMLGEYASGAWVPAVGLALVGLAIVAAHYRAPVEDDPGTTTVVALLLTYCLGALCWYGERTLAAAIAVGAAALLYFKAELRGILERFERRDLLAVIQFATLSVVILPVLPDKSYGPYGALNPYQIWLMVVLISGLSLAGYIALKIVGARRGLPLVGVFGGLVSSTATTLAFSKHAREASSVVDVAAGVIVLANLTVLVRSRSSRPRSRRQSSLASRRSSARRSWPGRRRRSSSGAAASSERPNSRCPGSRTPRNCARRSASARCSRSYCSPRRGFRTSRARAGCMPWRWCWGSPTSTP